MSQQSDARRFRRQYREIVKSHPEYVESHVSLAVLSRTDRRAAAMALGLPVSKAALPEEARRPYGNRATKRAAVRVARLAARLAA